MQNMFSWMSTSEEYRSDAVNKLRRIGFADMKHAVQHAYTLINTLPETQQGCLVQGTIPASEEEEYINDLLEHDEVDKIVVLYGAHSADDTVEKKAADLMEAGFRRIYVYGGGLFEWLLLQDVYGDTEFLTTSKVTDFLAYQPTRRKF